MRMSNEKFFWQRILRTWDIIEHRDGNARCHLPVWRSFLDACLVSQSIADDNFYGSAIVRDCMGFSQGRPVT